MQCWLIQESVVYFRTLWNDFLSGSQSVAPGPVDTWERIKKVNSQAPFQFSKSENLRMGLFSDVLVNAEMPILQSLLVPEVYILPLWLISSYQRDVLEHGVVKRCTHSTLPCWEADSAEFIAGPEIWVSPGFLDDSDARWNLRTIALTDPQELCHLEFWGERMARCLVLAVKYLGVNPTPPFPDLRQVPGI